jgi:hypothetical protein
MKRFWLDRVSDISGTSGTGRVAEGVVFSNGWCAMHWLSKYTSVAFYQSVAELEAIHGHNGATVVVFEEPAQALATLGESVSYSVQTGEEGQSEARNPLP